MESLVFMNNIVLKNFFSLNFCFVSLFSKTAVITVLLVSLFLIKIFYQNLRQKFSVTVNCWFCCINTKIPYELRNGWNCPFCAQYNGFNKEGDYNKIIEEQYNLKLNPNIFADVKKTIVDSKLTNGLCKLCNINQQLKIQQLASFVPLNEMKFDEEIEDYRQKLEKAYKLCSDCENILQETLKRQDSFFLKNKNNICYSKPFTWKNVQNIEKFDWKKQILKFKKYGIKGMKCLFLGITCLQFLALIVQYEREKHLLSYKFQDLIIAETTQVMINEYIVFLNKVHILGRELSLAAIFLLLLSMLAHQNTSDQTNLVVNCFIHILYWINLTEFQLVLCAVSLFLGWKSTWRKINLEKSRLESKKDFSPQEGIVLGNSNYCFNHIEPNELLPENLKPCPIIEEEKLEHINNKRSQKMLKGNEKKSEKKKKIVEVESNCYEKLNCSISPTGITKTTNATTTIPSLFSKTFLDTLEANKIDNKSNPPFDEVSSNLSELSLGGKQTKSSKPSNFLFHSHNFSDKKNTSIIKPAKFIKNLSNSWTCSESNESVSRSSTPSSGYSSQKQEQNPYDLCKTMNSFNCNALGRRYRYDYFDENNGFYNFNYYPQNFIPFQQFSSPLGHTAIYTYTRPTNFAFPFPQQGFPSFKYSTPTPRFSDASDCENLFQNTSKNFLNEKRWFKLKHISYYISILLNCITLFIILYFFFTGIISI